MLFNFETLLEFLFVFERAIVRIFARRALELDHVVLGHTERKGKKRNVWRDCSGK